MSSFREIWKYDSWVRPYLRTYGKLLALALVLSVLTFVFASALMFTSGFMISLAAAVPLTVLALHLPSIFVRIFGIGKPLLHYAERLTSHDWVLRMTSELRRKLYDTLASGAEAFRSKTRLGSILALLTDDIGHVQNLFLRSVLPLATAWIVAFLTIVLAGVLSWQLGVFMLLVLITAVVVMPMWSVAVNGARLVRMQQLRHSLYENITDDVYGATDWMLSGRSNVCVEETMQKRKQLRDEQGAINSFRRWHDLLAQTLFGICAAGVFLWAAWTFGAGFENDGLAGLIGSSGSANAPAYAPNWIAAFVLCVFPLTEAFAQASDAMMDARIQKSALERLNRFSDDAKCSNSDSSAPMRFAQNDTIGKYDIKMTGVSFEYANGASVFSDFNLHVPYGQTVAVMGPSGAGKTTLASLIHGDHAPTAGTVRIGGIDPYACKDSIWQLVGIIQQSPHLFNMTLRENLLIAKPNATDNELIEILNKVNLGELLATLPLGLDTPMQEHGMRFSGGERHRIALARILLTDVPIVILDEPFNSLDERTEHDLLHTMFNTLKGRTIIMITHNEKTAKACQTSCRL